MRKYFEENNFLEVSTPIITAGAGGASATPFETRAQEFPDEPLTLRIAPELFLKRMVIGTGERIYELGTVFRNEGKSSFSHYDPQAYSNYRHRRNT